MHGCSIRSREHRPSARHVRASHADPAAAAACCRPRLGRGGRLKGLRWRLAGRPGLGTVVRRAGRVRERSACRRTGAALGDVTRRVAFCCRARLTARLSGPVC